MSSAIFSPRMNLAVLRQLVQAHADVTAAEPLRRLFTSVAEQVFPAEDGGEDAELRRRHRRYREDLHQLTAAGCFLQAALAMVDLLAPGSDKSLEIGAERTSCTLFPGPTAPQQGIAAASGAAAEAGVAVLTALLRLLRVGDGA